LWTVALHFPLIWLPRKVLGPRRNPHVIGLWGRGLGKIMGIHIHPKNRRSGPMGDVVVANHMGFLDIPILLSFYPAVFIIKEEMHKVFFFGKALEDEGHVFVDRADRRSGKEALRGVEEVLAEGGRIIVFPEGGASPGAERRPFKPGSFAVAQRLGKKVEVCVIDYLPDRKMLEWDVKRPMLPQLVDLFGRRRIDVSVEFFPAEDVEGDPAAYAAKWHDFVQRRLEEQTAEEDGVGRRT
jgi:1-acyl-sn-glycerol-3-phosphate acyltransferase